MKIEIEPIGFVHNCIKEPVTPSRIKEQTSTIEVDPKYIKGLKGIEECEYIDILFNFNLNDEVQFIVNSPMVQNKGVFATRSPSRPNHIGVTTVKVLGMDKNRIKVTGLDAIDGTPVIDIKCCDTSAYDLATVNKAIQGENPRIDITRAILSNNREDLLYKAGQIHGHICPGIAMGVLCGAEIMKKILLAKKDPFDYKMTAEQPNCVLDGMMFVTGFTPGRRQLKLLQGDKMRYTITNDKGEGWLIETGDHNRAYINEVIPDDLPKLEKGKRVLGLDFTKVFDVTELKAKE